MTNGKCYAIMQDNGNHQLRKFRTLPYRTKPIVDITLMATVLSMFVTIHSECYSAVCTLYLIYRLTLNLVKILVPPYITALVAAELLFLTVWCLLDCHSAVLAINSVCYWCEAIFLVTLAKRLAQSHNKTDFIPKLEV